MPSIRKEGCVSSILLGFSHVMCTWVPALVLAQILIQSVRGWVWDSAFSANSQATSLPLVCSPHFDLDPKPVAATEGTRPRRWCEHSSNHGWFPWQQFFRGTPSAQPPPTRSRLSEPHHLPHWHLWKHIGNWLSREENLQWDTWSAPQLFTQEEAPWFQHFSKRPVPPSPHSFWKLQVTEVPEASGPQNAASQPWFELCHYSE